MLSDQHASPELHEAFSWLERDVIDALKMYGERIMPWKTNAPAAIGAEEYGR